MAFGKKYEAAASGGTHKQVDATITDVLLPHAELDSTGSMVRSAIYVAGTYFVTRKVITGSFSS